MDTTAIPAPRTAVPDVGGDGRRRGPRCLHAVAHEDHAGYDRPTLRTRPATQGTDPAVTTPEGAAPSGAAPSGGAPLDSPVLAELPELGQALADVAQADRLLVEAVLRLTPLLEEGRIESTTGLGIEHWLAATAHVAGIDRRMLRRLCRLLHRLPALAAGATAGRVSFTQLRALTLDLHRAPRAIDAQLDAWLAAAIDQLPHDADPDILVRHAARALDELSPHTLDEETDQVDRRLVIQPNLTGTGGTFHGTEDAVGIAMLDAATAPRRDQLHDVGRGRADNLLAHLQHTGTLCPNDHGAERDTDPQDQPDDVGNTPAAGDALEDGEVIAPGGSLETDNALQDGESSDAPGPPTLLLRWDFHALLDRTSSPADILTRLVGGRLRMTSRHARELIEHRGARIRTIVVDEGEVIGVGRTTRIPPGWLRDATLAIHDTCTEPLCDRPALGADVDHARPWHPHDHMAGTTDLDNLGPLCGSTNRSRHAAGWRIDQSRPGTRTWRHPRTGVTLTSLPATWRPRGIPPPPSRDHDDHDRSPTVPSHDPPDRGPSSADGPFRNGPVDGATGGGSAPGQHETAADDPLPF